jgi:hypothetical protein
MKIPTNCTYVKLKDNVVGMLWSDDTHNDIINVILEIDWNNKEGDYDPLQVRNFRFRYEDVAITDSNLTLVKSYIVKEPKVVKCLNSLSYESVKLLYNENIP